MAGLHSNSSVDDGNLGKSQNAVKKAVLFSVFLYATGYGMMLPALPSLVVEIGDFSLSKATLIGGYIATSYAFFQFLFGPFMGNLSDRFGRKPIFLACIAGTVLDLLIMGIAPSIFWLFIGRMIAGGFGIIFGPANAIMADITSPEERTKSFGLTGAAFGVGLVIGPALGGALGEFGVRTPFLVAAVIMTANFIITWWKVPETLPVHNRRNFELKRANPLGSILSLSAQKGLLSLCIVIAVWQFSFGIYQTTWLFFSSLKFGWDSVMIGASLAIIGISVVIVQGALMGRLIAKFGERNIALFAMFIALITCAGFIATDITLVALMLCALVGLQAMAIPCVIGIMSQKLPTESQGELQGFFSSATALASLLAPLIYNSTLSYYTSPTATVQFAGAPFVIAAVLAISAMIILFVSRYDYSVAK